ncbi:MAG: MBL fold metallo-hydrolase [Clostridiales bacterium]|nr:MBL fold metallo-hydrolase [Clostridiales bacterium]
MEERRKRRFSGKRSIRGGFFGRGLVAVLLSILLTVCPGNLFWLSPVQAAEQTGDMAVHILDVGQGLAILVQSGGQNLVYDGGGRETSSYVVSYLENQQVSTIDYLISSHYDEDHLAGLVGCLNSFQVNMVIGSDYLQDTQIYESFMAAVEEEGLQVQHPEIGSEYAFGTGSFTVLAPQAISSSDNDNSVVIKLENGSNSFLFAGDAESGSEEAMLSSGLDLSCDVLVLGHHGSASSTSWDFLAATVPEYAVISCGDGNAYGHPHEETMEKLSSMEISVFRTDVQGSFAAVSNGAEITWTQEPCNDYSDGDSQGDTTAAGQTQTSGQSVEEEASAVVTQEPAAESADTNEAMVWISATGSKYHNKNNCGNMNPDKAYQMTLSDAQAAGYEACKKCY